MPTALPTYIGSIQIKQNCIRFLIISLFLGPFIGRERLFCTRFFGQHVSPPLLPRVKQRLWTSDKKGFRFAPIKATTAELFPVEEQGSVLCVSKYLKTLIAQPKAEGK